MGDLRYDTHLWLFNARFSRRTYKSNDCFSKSSRRDGSSAPTFGTATPFSLLLGSNQGALDSVHGRCVISHLTLFPAAEGSHHSPPMQMYQQTWRTNDVSCSSGLLSTHYRYSWLTATSVLQLAPTVCYAVIDVARSSAAQPAWLPCSVLPYIAHTADRNLPWWTQSIPSRRD